MHSGESKKSIQMKNVQDSVILICDVRGSILINDMESCMVTARCEQIRIHNSRDALYALTIPNHPIIEDCSSVFFAEDRSVWVHDGGKPVSKVIDCFVLHSRTRLTK